MRKIGAQYIFPVSHPPIKMGIIELDDQGIVKGITTNPEQKELDRVEFYNGVIVPGFVNSHCHLELSFLRNKIKLNQGMTSFFKDIVEERNAGEIDEIMKQANSLDKEMRDNGIVAVGDIVNKDHTQIIKNKSSIQYHNFLEVFGLDETKNEFIVSNTENLKQIFGHHSTPSFHTFFTLNTDLFERIMSEVFKSEGPVSIHFMESADEIQLMKEERGPLYDFLNGMVKGKTFWGKSTKDIFNTIKGISSFEKPFLFIHNTYAETEDIEIVHHYLKNPYWVMCPKSNLFIENRLPNIELFRKSTESIALGTDSMASNENLSIWDEMMVIFKNYPGFSFEEVLKWATWNGARALNLQSIVGSIEIGKKPGLNLVKNFDFVNFAPSEKSSIKVII